MLFQKILVVSFTVVFFWKLIKYMWSFLNIEKEPVTVLVTGAAGMFIIYISSFQLKLFISFYGFYITEGNFLKLKLVQIAKFSIETCDRILTYLINKYSEFYDCILHE